MIGRRALAIRTGGTLIAGIIMPIRARARSSLIFFDSESAELTPRAHEIMQQYVAEYRCVAGNLACSLRSYHVRSVHIEIAGHTDTRESPRRRQQLSEARARVMAEILILDGVPREIISIRGYADQRPLVPTGPNVAEPQNRRGEFVLR